MGRFLQHMSWVYSKSVRHATHTWESSAPPGRYGGGDVSVYKRHVVHRFHSSAPAAAQCAGPDVDPHHISPGNDTLSRRCRGLLDAWDNEETAAPKPVYSITSHGNNSKR